MPPHRTASTRTTGAVSRLAPVVVALAFATALSFVLATSVGAQTADEGPAEASPTPGWTIFERLDAMGLLHEQARAVLTRAMLEHSDMQRPGVACERILAAGRAPVHLVERCRTEAIPGVGALDGGAGRAEACRRAAQVAAPVSQVVERCRAWLANSDSGDTAALTPVEVCRRVAAADEPPSNWVERCRTWLGSQDEGANRGTITSICRRIAASESAPVELLERCRNALSQLDERPERLERPERPERPIRPEARPLTPAR